MALGRTRALTLTAAVAVLASGSVATAAAIAASDDQAARKLSRERTAHGIPGGIKAKAKWSKACHKHNVYMHKSGSFSHSENKSSRWYTRAGAWAGANAVLSYGLKWGMRNPWRTAPIHLAQLLYPGLKKIGYDEHKRYACATTYPGYKRKAPETPRIYSFPGDGFSGFPYAETAVEFPFTPGELVGLDGQTGPYIYLFNFGAAQGSVGKRKLTGPDGPVPTKVVDQTNQKISAYLPAGTAFVIPSDPLAQNSEYVLEVEMRDGKDRYERVITFATGSSAI